MVLSSVPLILSASWIILSKDLPQFKLNRSITTEYMEYILPYPKSWKYSVPLGEYQKEQVGFSSFLKGDLNSRVMSIGTPK